MKALTMLANNKDTEGSDKFFTLKNAIVKAD